MTMRRLLVFTCLLAAGGPLAFAQAPPTSDPRVEAHLLRVENAQLRALIAKLQTDLDAAKLSAERRALEEVLRAEQKLPATATFNWQTLRFEAPQEAKQ